MTITAPDDLLVARLKLTADLQAQMAGALTGKGQDEIRNHFIDSADLLFAAAKAIARKVSA